MTPALLLAAFALAAPTEPAPGPLKPGDPPPGSPTPIPGVQIGPDPSPHAHPPAVPSPSPSSALDCLRGCPPPHHGPFLRTPWVDGIGPCRDTTGKGGCDDEKNQWSHTFHKAARFAVPRFAQSGETVEADGLVIYEGMKLTVNRVTGVYDLSFTATAPPSHTTVRLQLVFAPPNGGDEVRLTLPPIQFEPEADVPGKLGEVLGPTVRVHHRGYSELFTPGRKSQSSDLQTRLSPTPITVDSDWAIGRGGTARFGSARPNSDDPTR